MALRDKLSVELAAEDIYGTGYHYTTLVLPATQGQIEDALQRVRAIGREKCVDIDVIACGKLQGLTEFRLDSPSIDELNFLAERIESLDDEQTMALQAVFSKYINDENFVEPIVMKDLINMTYGLENCYVMEGTFNDKILGECVKDGEMMECLEKLNTDIAELLDMEAVGAKFREMEEGMYVKGGYVATVGYEMPNVYDGKLLPESERKIIGGNFITMKVAKSGNPDPSDAEKNSVLIGLPIDRAKADEIARSLGEKRIEDCVYFDFQSPITWLDDEMYGDTEVFDKLNDIAKGYETLNSEDRVKFKAVCENEECNDLDRAKSIMDNIDRYQMSYHTPDYETYAREYMNLKLPTDFDTSVLQGCNLSALGRNIAARLECSLTDYGIVSKEGGSIFETITEEPEQDEIQEESEQEMGGMQM